MTREEVQGLIYYYSNSANLDEGIREATVEVLNDVIAKMDEEDPDTGKVVAEYATQKEALEAIGKDPKKAGISDSINGRTSTHRAYGFVWYFKDEWEAMGGKLPR